MRHCLAQVTIARMRQGFEHPDSAGLTARVAEMNRLAEGCRGFLWRLRGEEVDAGTLAGFASLFSPFDPRLVFYTLSVWASAEDLRQYVYHTDHVQMIRGAHQWIERSALPNVALWWVGEDDRPTVAESARRWRRLCELGPTQEAFDFRKIFAEPVTNSI